MTTPLEKLIEWLKTIQMGESPSIPYNLHPLVRCLHNGLGTHDAIDLLTQLRNLPLE